MSKNLCKKPANQTGDAIFQQVFAFMCVMCLIMWWSVDILSVTETIDFQFVDAREPSNDPRNLLLKERNRNMIEMIILTKVWK